jgi:hypothetical protein
MRFTHDPPPITVNHISKKKGIHRDSYFVQHALSPHSSPSRARKAHQPAKDETRMRGGSRA